jgi:hypothetical protein
MNQAMSEEDMRESLLRSSEFAVKNPDLGFADRLGLNVHIPSNSILDDVAMNLGMHWIRVDFDWYRIEPEQGRFQWEATDRIIARSRDLGMEVLATLAYTPPWASSNQGNPRISDPPASQNYWTDIVREATSRYGDQVLYWQLWNEPNLSQFWSGSMNQYRTDVLNPGAAVAKEHHPGCRIVCPGLANLGNWREWFEEIMRSKHLIDIINHHNYDSDGREVILSLERDSIFNPSLRTLMKDLGVDDKPFWLTETGRRTEEGGQLEFYQDVVATLRTRTWVHRLFFFHYWDGPGQGNGGFGIVNEDFTPKPAYHFLKSVLQPSAARTQAVEV